MKRQINNIRAEMKVYRCIQSCKTFKQLESCKRLLDNTVRMFNVDKKMLTEELEWKHVLLR